MKMFSTALDKAYGSHYFARGQGPLKSNHLPDRDISGLHFIIRDAGAQKTRSPLATPGSQAVRQSGRLSEVPSKSAQEKNKTMS